MIVIDVTSPEQGAEIQRIIRGDLTASAESFGGEVIDGYLGKTCLKPQVYTDALGEHITHPENIKVPFHWWQGSPTAMEDSLKVRDSACLAVKDYETRDYIPIVSEDP